MGIAENNITNFNASKYGLLEQVLSPTNLNLSFKKVRAKSGSGGVDKMEVESLKDYLVEHKYELFTSRVNGNICPNPTRRVGIPKENNKKRMLGILM